VTWKAGTIAALMTVRSKDGPPSLEEAAVQLGLAVDDLDPAFGVVTIDPERRLYTVRADASKLGDFDSDRGPFSDPPIAPMR
jgi:hypothetical protein